MSFLWDITTAIQNDYSAPEAEVLRSVFFDFPIQLVLGLQFADVCARGNLSSVSVFYQLKEHSCLGKQTSRQGAVPKPDLGFENGMKNLLNSLCIKLLDTHLCSGPPSRNEALAVGWYCVCHCFVLSRFGHACGIWRHICAIVAAPLSSLVHLCIVRNCHSCSKQ